MKSIGLRSLLVIGTTSLLAIACGEAPQEEVKSNTKESPPSLMTTASKNQTTRSIEQAACTAGNVLTDGIVIKQEPNECIVMEKTDRALCRSTDNHEQCVTWSQAASLCEGGTQPGEEWYLPSSTELELIWQHRGNGTPVTDQGICATSSGACSWNFSTSFPVTYFSSTSGAAGTHYILDQGNMVFGHDSYRRSVRCVQRRPFGSSSADGSDLVAYYPFNGNADDASDYEHHGIVTEAVLTTDRHNQANQAYEFDGVDDQIHATTTPELEITEQITLVGWMFPTEQKTQHLVRKGSNVLETYGLSTSATNDIIFTLTLDSEFTQVRKTEYPLNEWTFVAGTYDGIDMKLYVNGALVNTRNATGMLTQNNEPLVIGTRLSLLSNTFKGKLDEIRVYRRALSGSEIQALYEADPPDITPLTCEIGEHAHGGIVIQEDNGECVVMEETDRAACRGTDNYNQCVTWSEAANLCEGGIEPGAEWYLPNRTELGWVWAQRGSGHPVSSNNLCVYGYGECRWNYFTSFPYTYFSSTPGSASTHYILSYGSLIFGHDSYRRSARCVKRVSLDPPDTTPPAPITDLQATRSGNDAVDLLWTAVGDDGLSGTASRYEIRYAMTPITNDAQCDAATEVSQTLIPHSSGTQESFNVSNLLPERTYHFCVRAFDEVDNRGSWNGPESSVSLDIPQHVTAAGSYSCLLLGDGTVKCWGASHSVANQHFSGTELPTDPVCSDFRCDMALSNVTQISARELTSCAIVEGGQAFCWGSSGQFGSLGNGSQASNRYPVQVSGPDGFLEISAGSHSCARYTDGKVRCWGRGQGGALGIGTTDNSFVPVEVSGLSNVRQIDVGGFHTCAVLDDYSLQCWGLNSGGQLGMGENTPSEVLTPMTVPGLPEVKQVDAGGFHTCAIVKDNGQVFCWGHNFYGQVSSDQVSYYHEPQAVPGISNAIQVITGSSFSCALLAGGEVQCWGVDGHQLFDLNLSHLPPTPKEGLSEVIQIAGDGYHACALQQDGAVSCWGDNNRGQLGDGTLIGRTTPAPVVGL